MSNARVRLVQLCWFLALILATSTLFGQPIVPDLPRTSSLVTCFPDTTGYARITVGSVNCQFQDLQLAINSAPLPSVIVLTSGETFNGNFILPEKSVGSGWVIITCTRASELPSQSNRVDPRHAGLMAQLITTNRSGLPAIRTAPRAHHYRIVGLAITADETVTECYGLVNLGQSGDGQRTLEEVPNQLIVDRCFIYGHDKASIMKYGVRLDCMNGAVLDSYVSGFHSIGFDAQAISGINGPGPFKIYNNYLEGSGENIMFGGGAPSIPGLVPSDIEIRRNQLRKPFTWRVGHPLYSGKHWTIKNLFELKTGIRVLVDGNRMENSWADLPIGQSGYAILLTVRTENGQSPQANVRDVTITNNIIDSVGAGISISGTDDGVGIKTSRILIANNIFTNIDGPALGDGNNAGPNVGTFLKIGNPNDVVVRNNTIFQTGPITWAISPMVGFHFIGNRVNCLRSAGGYQGIYGPGKSEGNVSLLHFFPDITDANQHFHNNALIGGVAARYSNYATVSRNLFPQNANGIPTDIGADQLQIELAFQFKDSCEIISTVHEGRRQAPLFDAFPNPAQAFITIRGTSGGATHFTLYDITGRTVAGGNFEGDQYTVSTSHLESGLYVLSIKSSDLGTTRNTLIIKN